MKPDITARHRQAMDDVDGVPAHLLGDEKRLQFASADAACALEFAMR